MEDLPLHGAALDHCALVVAEAVEARLQQRLDRRRHRQRTAAFLAHHRDHLLDEQWISVRRCEDASADVGVEGDAVEQVVEELVDVPLRQRLEQDRRGVRLAAAPHGPCVEQLRARDAEQEDRPVARPVRDVLDDVEERLLRPLEIVEDDDERLLRGGALEQAAERELRLGRRRAEDRVRVGAELKNDLDERPVGDAFAVGEAAARELRARRPTRRSRARGATCRRPRGRAG